MIELQKERLRKAFTDSLPLPERLEPHLKKALTRVLNNHGSLIRPEIVMDLAVGYGLPLNLATDLAVGLEYFHTASLLFDDLPSMDDALERRGTPCVHIEFGDAGAILAGLALINRAYFLVWRAAAACDSTQQMAALSYLEHYLGVGGLLHGQSMDLHYASLPRGRETAEQISIGKTVSLMRLTLVLPAMLGGASPRELHLLNRIALFWGLSYQIADDLKDVLQSSFESGKTALRDQSLGRPNIALILGVGAAVERLHRFIAMGDTMVRKLVSIKPNLRFLEAIRAELGEEARVLTQSACGETVGASS
jgi:geranylgeranyl diphosphate synthase type II